MNKSFKYKTVRDIHGINIFDILHWPADGNAYIVVGKKLRPGAGFDSRRRWQPYMIEAVKISDFDPEMIIEICVKIHKI